MGKHVAKYETGLFRFMFIVNVTLIAGCAFVAMRIFAILGFPYFLSFIPLILGICVGIAITSYLDYLTFRFMQAKKTFNG